MLIRKQSFSLFPSAVGDKLFLAIYLIDGLLIIRKKHQFIERIVGNHIECELGGVRDEILTPPLKLQRWETEGSNRCPTMTLSI